MVTASWLGYTASALSGLPSLGCVLLLLCAGCAPLRVALDRRVDPITVGEPPRREAVAGWNDTADRLQATADFYDRQARKAHGKTRAMAVLAALGAGGAGVTVGVLAQPALADDARPGLASVGISLGVLSGLFAILPQTHQYPLKEIGYRRQAEIARQAYAAAIVRCPAGVLADPTTPLPVLADCQAELERGLDAAQTWPVDAAGTRPPPDELQGLVRDARQAP